MKHSIIELSPAQNSIIELSPAQNVDSIIDLTNVDSIIELSPAQNGFANEYSFRTISLRKDATLREMIDEMKEERKSKILFQIFIASAIIIECILAVFVDNLTVYDLFAFGICYDALAFDIYLIFVVSTFKHLHFMRVRRRKAENAKYLFLPYSFEEKTNIPMSSISMLVMLRGSNVEHVFNLLWNSKFIFIVCSIFTKLIELKPPNNTNYKTYIALLLFFIGSYGFHNVTLWELDKHSSFSNKMHYLSVITLIVGSGFCFTLSQEWSAFSVCLLILIWTFFLSWLVFMEYVQRYDYKGDLQRVHRYSIIVVVLETLALNMVYLAMASFVYCMNGDKIIVFT